MISIKNSFCNIGNLFHSISILDDDSDFNISKAYLTYDDIVYGDIDDLDSSKTIDIDFKSSFFSDTKIALSIQKELDSEFTYNKIYLTNSKRKIIYCILINKKTTKSIYDDIIIDLKVSTKTSK